MSDLIYLTGLSGSILSSGTSFSAAIMAAINLGVKTAQKKSVNMRK